MWSNERFSRMTMTIVSMSESGMVFSRFGFPAELRRLPIADQPASALRRMGADRVLIGLAAPAGAVGHGGMAVLGPRLVAEQLLVPVEPVDVDLHDAQIRLACGEMHCEERGQAS